VAGFIRRLFSRPILDFAQGDFVRCAGWRGVWWVKDLVERDQAWVARDSGWRMLVLLVNLKHARPKEAGHLLDRRGARRAVLASGIQWVGST
jgi:hypothetical protein